MHVYLIKHKESILYLFIRVLHNKICAYLIEHKESVLYLQTTITIRILHN